MSFKLIYSELQNADIETLTFQNVKLINRNSYNTSVSISLKLPATFLELYNIFNIMEFKTNNK